MKHGENSFLLSNGFVEVKDSKTHGLGLFSKKFIPKGFVFGAGLIDKSLAGEYEAKDLHGAHDKKYKGLNVFQVGGSRYINHSLDPNVRYQVKDKMSIAIAIKDIKEGEEITLNYFEFFSEAGLPLPAFLLNKIKK
jgi:SET domain-containing protein